MITIFKRSWWTKENGQIVPTPSRPVFVKTVPTEEDARDFCTKANNELPTYNPLSHKYEFTAGSL